MRGSLEAEEEAYPKKGKCVSSEMLLALDEDLRRVNARNMAGESPSRAIIAPSLIHETCLKITTSPDDARCAVQCSR